MYRLTWPSLPDITDAFKAKDETHYDFISVYHSAAAILVEILPRLTLLFPLFSLYSKGIQIGINGKFFNFHFQ
jgi:hypothetical protein